MRKWLIGLGLVILALVVAGVVLTASLQGRAKRRFEKLLTDRFDSDVKIEHLTASLFPQASVTAERVELRYHRRTDVPPMISIQKISSDSDLPSLLLGVQHDVRLVRLDGLRITIPAGTMNRKQFEPNQSATDQKNNQEGDHLPFVVHRIVADGAVLVILPKQKDHDPLEWDMEKLTLTSVGPKRPMHFVTTLTNAKPPGRIMSSGSFGPWRKEDPGSTDVSGDYTFNDADMGVFKGISGILSSVGQYSGSLDHIDVNGKTDIPEFQVGDGEPVNLKTTFSATVDGTNGNTLLHPVDATFLQSEFVCNGGVTSTPGIKGKKVELDAVAKKARIDDILRLVLKAKGEPPLTGNVKFRSKIVIPQGDVPVIEKLILDGQFGVTRAEFTSDKVQDKLDLLSNRSRGLKGGRRWNDVNSDLKGKFVLRNATIRLSSLAFSVPGIWVNLDGTYGIRSEKVDFQGKVELQGKLSQMTTGWKSLLLRAADPFFRDGKRTVIPVKIEGTRSDPKIGLDFVHRKADERSSR